MQSVYDKIRIAKDERRFTQELNEHVEQCQVCATGFLCEIAERIMDRAEQGNEQRKRENKERKLRDAGL